MSERCSKAIVRILLKKGLIERNESEIYCYGYETLIYSIEQMMLLILAGIILQRGWETVVFTIVFVSLRRHTGGYHAHTRAGCTCMTFMMYAFVICMAQIEAVNTVLIHLLLFVFYWRAFLKHVPVEHSDKPLSHRQRRRNKTSSFCLSTLYMGIGSLMSLYGICAGTGRTIVYTMFTVSFLVVFKGFNSILLQKG